MAVAVRSLMAIERTSETASSLRSFEEFAFALQLGMLFLRVVRESLRVAIWVSTKVHQ